MAPASGAPAGYAPVATSDSSGDAFLQRMKASPLKNSMEFMSKWRGPDSSIQSSLSAPHDLCWAMRWLCSRVQKSDSQNWAHVWAEVIK